MKLQPIPRSKAKTAWGLLEDVKKHLLAEPKRANQGCFMNERLPEAGGPKCGTVGCIAGWISLLRGQRSRSNAELFAQHVLGEGVRYYVPVGGDNYDYVFSPGDKDIRGNPGTKLHAQSVVRRIERFQKINEKVLKARRLDPL